MPPLTAYYLPPLNGYTGAVATPGFGQLNRLPVAAKMKIFAYVYETVDALDLKSIIQASGVQGAVTAILDVGGPNDQPLFVSKLFMIASFMEIHRITTPQAGAAEDVMFYLQLVADSAEKPFFTIHITATCVNTIDWGQVSQVKAVYNKGLAIDFARHIEVPVSPTWMIPLIRLKSTLVLPYSTLLHPFEVFTDGHTIYLNTLNIPSLINGLVGGTKNDKPRGCLHPGHCTCHKGMISAKNIQARAVTSVEVSLWLPTFGDSFPSSLADCQRLEMPKWQEGGFCSDH